jgi:SAM-dependent methyltransferase
LIAAAVKIYNDTHRLIERTGKTAVNVLEDQLDIGKAFFRSATLEGDRKESPAPARGSDLGPGWPVAFRVMSDLPRGAIPGRAVDRGAEDFDESYKGTPPWDIGRPQPVFAALMEEGAIRGRVLDAGCGTGEHTLMAAARGLDATGVDASPRAIQIATHKATDRGVTARFLVWDALALSDLNEQFDTVLDSGLFHVFDDERRAQYVTSLATVLRPAGCVLLACFSDRQPGDWGPRRVRQTELRTAFDNGWVIESIEPVRLHTNLEPPVADAWLARIVSTAT